jgi:transcriptional regulator with XRE-family HTH domain
VSRGLIIAWRVLLLCVTLGKRGITVGAGMGWARETQGGWRPGEVVRAARQRNGLTLAELGARTGYSAAQVSRYERGVTPLTDVVVLRRFAEALGIPPVAFGLAGRPGLDGDGDGRRAVTRVLSRAAWSSVAGGRGERDDDVRRRQLLATLGVAAASAASRPAAGAATAMPGDAGLAELLVARVRDAMLGLAQTPSPASVQAVRAGLDGALADFRDSRYSRLAVIVPRLLSAGHLLAAGGESRERDVLLAGIYTITTRMLIKLDDQQLGWMAADRARLLASGGGDPLAAGEAARNLAVLARKAGWHDQASSIALSAAASPLLAGKAPRLAAERGLLIQSAAYTAARAGDRDTMRELTSQAASIAARLRDANLLRDHGGGFTPATVGLHRISAENYAGDPGAAIAAADRILPASLPTTERRARYWTDTARAWAAWGKRDECLSALLAAEREAPEEIHARPAVRDLVSGMLVTGRTGPELRGLAARCGIT